MDDRLTGGASVSTRPSGRARKGHAARKAAAPDLKRLEELWSRGAAARQHSDLVSHQNVQNDLVPREIITPVEERGLPRPRHPLPLLPEGLSWPRPRLPDVSEADRTDDDYDRAPECGQPGGLKRYLERVWGETRLKHIDMPTMREHWPRLGEAIDRKRGILSAKMQLPALKSELTDQIATELPKRDRPWHVEKALQMRAYRARRKVREAEVS